MDRQQRVVEWWSVHADCHQDYHSCPQLSWKPDDLDGDLLLSYCYRKFAVRLMAYTVMQQTKEYTDALAVLF